MKYFSWLCLFLIGCAPVYVPNVRNTPMFKKAGEFQGKIYYNPFVGAGGGIDLQGAGSVTNHIGLMFNYATSHNLKDEGDYFKHHYFEGGLGYFKTIEKSKSIYLHLFAGYGKGEDTNHDTFFTHSSSTALTAFKYDRYFIQPSFGRGGKRASFCASIRISDVNFKSYSESGISYSLKSSPTIFIEPSFTGQLNFSKEKPVLFLTAQIGVNVPTDGLHNGNTMFYNNYDFTWLTAALGLGFRFDFSKKDVASAQ